MQLKNNSNEEFINALQEENIEKIKELFKNENLEKEIFESSFISDAFFQCPIDIIRLLMSHKYFNPNMNNGILLEFAIVRDELEITKELFKKMGSKYSSTINFAILYLYENNGQKITKTIEYLFKIKEVKKLIKENSIELYNDLNKINLKNSIKEF